MFLKVHCFYYPSETQVMWKLNLSVLYHITNPQYSIHFLKIFFSFLSVYVQIYWLFPLSSPFFSLIHPVSFQFLLCFSHLKLAFGSAFMSSIILLRLSIFPFISEYLALLLGIHLNTYFKVFLWSFLHLCHLRFDICWLSFFLCDTLILFFSCKLF